MLPCWLFAKDDSGGLLNALKPLLECVSVAVVDKDGDDDDEDDVDLLPGGGAILIPVGGGGKSPDPAMVLGLFRAKPVVFC